MTDEEHNKLIIFQSKEIRRTWFNDEWWFVIKDIIAIITESSNPSGYLKKLRKRDQSLDDVFKGGDKLSPPGFEFDTRGGRQLMQCWNTLGIFQLIQSIPSKNAEPFKRWLAKVGCERLEEIENPEIATKRMREIYKQKTRSNLYSKTRRLGRTKKINFVKSI